MRRPVLAFKMPYLRGRRAFGFCATRVEQMGFSASLPQFQSARRPVLSDGVGLSRERRNEPQWVSGRHDAGRDSAGDRPEGQAEPSSPGASDDEPECAAGNLQPEHAAEAVPFEPGNLR